MHGYATAQTLKSSGGIKFEDIFLFLKVLLSMLDGLEYKMFLSISYKYTKYNKV